MILRKLKQFQSRLQAARNPTAFARSLGVVIGKDCRLIGVSEATFGSEPYLITLGDHVTITSGVRFVTHDGGVWVLRAEDPTIDVLAPIRVGTNVFLGLNTIILPGVTIGDNAVIGAGSVVNRDIPANSVAAGVPAKPIADLETYRVRSLQRSLGTKLLSPHDKRVLLMRRFSSEP